MFSFFPFFSSYIYALCSTRPSLIYSTNRVLRDFENDGVVYLELRTTPRASASVSKEQYVATILSCIEGHGRASMTTSLILSIDRRDTIVEAMEVVELAIEYCDRGVVGVDLCGDPTKGDVSIFRDAFAKAKQHGLGITLHFAEVPASSTIQELETLLSFKPDRLGHLCHVPEHLKQEIIRTGCGLELCVSCNVQAKLIEGGIADHHFGFWKETNCPLALCVSVGQTNHLYLAEFGRPTTLVCSVAASLTSTS